MTRLQTSYMGLILKNPLIAGSSGLTNSLNQIKLLADAGIGAVVLKSLFEEQINLEIDNVIKGNDQNAGYPEAEDYIRNYTKMNSIQRYLDFITSVKATVDIPVLASVNCTSVSGWIEFVADMEKAGADGIVLNIYELPLDKNKSSEKYEHQYFEVLSAIKKRVKIPVAVKIGPYFTNLVRMVDQLHANGANAVILFNRFYEPDFDLDKLEFTSSEIMSSPNDLRSALRWTGIVKGELQNVEIAASTGIHNGSGALKQLLAGAQVVQLCSTLYLNGPSVIGEILHEMQEFMKKWNFKTIDDFRGRMSYKNIPNPSVYERAQFMKYFSNHQH